MRFVRWTAKATDYSEYVIQIF